MAEEAASGFTQGETALLVTIMQNLKSNIDFDADAVAFQLGYKSGAIVKTRWSQIKRNKINGAGAAVGASPSGVKKAVATPKNGTKGESAEKRVARMGTGSGDDEERADTPVKGSAKAKGKGKAKKVDDGVEKNDGNSDKESNVKIKAEAEEEEEF